MVAEKAEAVGLLHEIVALDELLALCLFTIAPLHKAGMFAV